MHKDNRARISNVKLMKLLVASLCWNISHLLWAKFLTRHQQELLDLPNISSPNRKGSVSQAIDLMYTGYGAAATWPQPSFDLPDLSSKNVSWLYGINVYWLHWRHFWKHLSSTRISNESPNLCGNIVRLCPSELALKINNSLRPVQNYQLLNAPILNRVLVKV